MIHWAALGIFFKAASWPIAYLIIAKGDSKTFFMSELAVNIYMLGFNILGYLLGGLEGLGISFLIGYLFYLCQVFLIAKKKYAFSFLGTFIKITGIQFLLGVACFLSSRYISSPYLYIIGSVLILASVYYSYRELDKRLGIKSILINLFRSKKEVK